MTKFCSLLRILIILRNGKYDLDFKNPASDPTTYLESNKLAELYQEFIKDFPMVSIEDPFDQDDWAAWTSLTGNTPIQVKRRKERTIWNVFKILFILLSFRSLVTISRSQTPSASKWPLIARHATACFSRWTKSEPWLNPLPLTSWPRLTDGEPWSLTAPARPKIPSSAIWSLDCPLAR